MSNNKFFISKEELKRKAKEREELLNKDSKVKEIIAEWITYEELDRRTKKILPALDESKIKTFIIEPFFYEKNETIKSNYYERKDYHFKK